MLGQDEQRRPHWSEDFVEHVRTVNFSLVVVCLALIGLVQFERPRDVTTAQSELKEIRSAVDKWDGPDFQGGVRDAISQQGGALGIPETSAFLINDKSFAFSRESVLLVPTELSSNRRALSVSEFIPSLGRPSSLLEFRKIWDLLSNKIEVISPDLNSLGDNVIVVESGGSARLSKYTRYRVSSGGWEILSVKVSNDADKRIFSSLNLSASSCVYSAGVGDKKFLVPVSCSSRLIDAQSGILSAHPYWKPGPFASSFSDLDKATADMQQRSFDAISLELDKEAAKPKAESFEVFGVKFPVDSAVRWGIILIVGIQLYLWIHLHELSPRLKKGDPGWDVAWIGVYESAPARWLFISSTSLLPLATILLLGKHALKHPSWSLWLVYVVSLSLSLIFSVLIAKWTPNERGARPEPRSSGTARA